MESRKRELKDCTFFNFNAEIAINIGVGIATGSYNLNARTNQWLFEFIDFTDFTITNHLTRYSKLFGTYTTDEQYKYV